MARQYLRITPEAAWGVYNPSGTAAIVQIDRDNSFTMRPRPILWTIRSAGGSNRRVQTGASKTGVKGGLNILCYGSQMAAIAPWVCASSDNVLGSATLDHAIVMEDAANTTAYRRYLGVMVDQAQFTASEQDPLLRLQLQLTAQQPATIAAADFPEPHAADYPGDAPYVFEMASGALTLGSRRVEFDAFTVTIKNRLDARFMASPYLTRLKYVGRDVDWTARFPYVTTVDRADYEAVTAVSGAIALANGGHTLTFALQGRNYLAEVEDDLALDKLHLQQIQAAAFLDGGASPANDFSLVAT
jgi:Phage tail tube protein